MKTFNFYHKNTSVRITLSASNFEEAEKILFETVKDSYGWRVEDEDGEEEF
jgi:type II secretory pathway component PulL